MRRAYPSDISRDQFEKILPILLQSRKRTRPHSVDLCEVFCAVLYLGELEENNDIILYQNIFSQAQTEYAVVRTELLHLIS